MRKALFTPNGEKVTGLLETIQNEHYMRLEEDSPETPPYSLEYTGDNPFWDGSADVLDWRGVRIFLDEHGTSWPEDCLRVAPEDEPPPPIEYERPEPPGAEVIQDLELGQLWKGTRDLLMALAREGHSVILDRRQVALLAAYLPHYPSDDATN